MKVFSNGEGRGVDRYSSKSRFRTEGIQRCEGKKEEERRGEERRVR